MRQSHHKDIRRQDKAVNDPQWINAILKRGQLLSLAMVDTEGFPYVTTVSYGYENGIVYLHGVADGKKFEIISQNPKVCFQVVIDAELARNEIPCKCSWKYRSVTGFGRIRTLINTCEKNQALRMIMRQYDATFTDLPSFPDSLWIMCIDIDHLTGKSSIHPVSSSI